MTLVVVEKMIIVVVIIITPMVIIILLLLMLLLDQFVATIGNCMTQIVHIDLQVPSDLL